MYTTSATFTVWATDCLEGLFFHEIPFHRSLPLNACYHKNKQEKKWSYDQWVREINVWSFIPLVFSTAGILSPLQWMIVCAKGLQNWYQKGLKSHIVLWWISPNIYTQPIYSWQHRSKHGLCSAQGRVEKYLKLTVLYARTSVTTFCHSCPSCCLFMNFSLLCNNTHSVLWFKLSNSNCFKIFNSNWFFTVWEALL